MRKLLLPFVIIFGLTVLATIPSPASHSQQKTEPITKKGLVDALREKVLSSKELIREVQQSGVAFDLTSTEEADIRSAGKYLGKKGLDELIAAIKRNYRPDGSQQPTPTPVYPPFQAAYDDYKSELGGTKSDAEPIRLVYHAEHEYATAIWLDDFPDVYLLDDSGNKNLKSPKDLGIGSESFWWDDEEVLKRFRERFGEERGTPPSEEYPPYGPVAKGWFYYPQEWEWIGWRRKHCMYGDGAVHVQRFQHGLIMGGFRHVPEPENYQKSRILVLLKEELAYEGRWEEVVDKTNPGPPCGAPYRPPKKTK